MNQKVQELKVHFAQPEYNRLFQEVKRKWESYGRVGGQTIRLHDPTAAECRKIGGLVGELYETGRPISIKMNRLEEILLRSKWAVQIEELLSVLNGEPLVSKQQRKEIRQTAWDTFCDSFLAHCCRAEIVQWVGKLRDQSASGARTVRLLFDEEQSVAEELVAMCVTALENLPGWRGSSERLPVFANRLFGNPHALDADQSAGRMLYQSICDIMEVDSETGAEWKRDVLSRVGILLDDLASQVFVIGVQARETDPWQPLFRQAEYTRIPVILPLSFLQQKISWEPVKTLYVVENPAVFQSLIERWPSEKRLPPLVCTSGQLSVAAWRFLDSFVKEGASIRYGGDIDRSGIEIAIGLSNRYGEQFAAWRMGSDEYVGHLGIPMSPEEVAIIQGLRISWDDRLTGSILEQQKKMFQESVLEELFDDLLHE